MTPYSVRELFGSICIFNRFPHIYTGPHCDDAILDDIAQMLSLHEYGQYIHGRADSIAVIL